MYNLITEFSSNSLIVITLEKAVRKRKRWPLIVSFDVGLNCAIPAESTAAGREGRDRSVGSTTKPAVDPTSGDFPTCSSLYQPESLAVFGSSAVPSDAGEIA